jgi:cell division protein FtsI/penicillin-binding protein 2
MSARDIPHKANSVIHLLLIAFLLIILRVWYLATIKHDEYQEKALRPQRKTIVETAPRGTIRDRFNIPMAINKVQYNAAVCFDRIREIPLVSWQKVQGKKVKTYERRRYVEALSEMLGNALDMDPIGIEDLIYSKASIFPNTPFVIKEDVSESLYYQLHLIEKDWTGLMMQRAAKRYYPQGKTASDILGYMGAINQKQYLTIASEIEELSRFLNDREEGLPVPLPKGFYSAKDVESRLLELKEKAYTIHAHVGKSGIERKFDETLRGTFGKKEIELGAKGRFIQTLPGGKEAISGDRILLSLSSELQAYAEELLTLNEQDREKHFAQAGKGHDAIPSPWIKGGAIVAMIPATGEVVALASYPRFDSNDFHLTDKNRQEKIGEIYKWLETPRHVGAIWDGLMPLERELVTYTETKTLTWDQFLKSILSKDCQVKKALSKVKNVAAAVRITTMIRAIHKVMGLETIEETIDALYGGVTPDLVKEMRKEVDPFLSPIKLNLDKLLFLDLIRLAANGDDFSSKKLEFSSHLSLNEYRNLNQAFVLIHKEVQEKVESLYHERIFPLWRKKHFKAYLKEKREEEKEKKTYPHPYTDYLHEAERKLFTAFWNDHKWNFFDAFIYGNISKDLDLQPFLFHLSLKSKEASGELLSSLELIRLFNTPLALMETFRSFDELKDPLWGRYYSLRNKTLQGIAGSFYPRNGFGYGNSYAYRRATPIGSLFKVVTGYEALKQITQCGLPPLEIIDEMNKNIVTENGIVLGRHLDGTLITRHYKGGRMPRSHASLGKVDFRTAMERSSNIYFSLLASEVISHPAELQKTTKTFGFGKRTGIDLYGEIGGYVPDDLRDNKTGLYSFAIGQHSLVVTPLQTAGMLAAIGNGGAVLKPQIVKLTANASGVSKVERQVKQVVEMPVKVRTELMEGMRRVVMGDKGPVQPYRIRALYEHPKWIPEYKALQNQFIGKTSTAEFVHRPTLDREGGSLLCKDIWFGALSFKEGDDYRVDMPELVVVVYLKYGDYGKEAAPLAAQVIKKWREINEKTYDHGA